MVLANSRVKLVLVSHHFANEMLPSPIIFNCWKHHAGFLRQQALQPTSLDDLPERLLVIGNELMDVYTGVLSPVEIANQILAELSSRSLHSLDAFRKWIQENNGFRVTTLETDGSCWALRLGDETDRFIHIHPGRRTPHTIRVRANVLKTAVMVTAYVARHGGDRRDVALVNRIRTQYLNLSPMREVLADEGLGPILRLLQST